ncbi:MAG TPA: Wzz/FepE/Etk N-terminal domain-containing protein [Candidatus Acidoferrum sp.]|jgi:polysaccharide chain length determinant protein (PEP-CTERM system associated)|nr:Wzz/FepE/Etk N-terminal domain-containing protein [Candidatus Acidoferrum sp.]
MAANRELNSTDAKRVLRRYWWILPISMVLLTVIGWVAANVLPKRYTSQTMVLVEQPSVSSKYVDPVVSDDLNHRLATMQEQILSRSRLQPIIEKLNLYPEDRGKLQIDDLVEKLRGAITVKPVEVMQGTGPHQLPGFYISATFDTPQLAQQVCTEITSMFLAQNARQTEQQATRTTNFLGEQLAEAKKKLDQEDAKLAEFKRQHPGSLPEDTQSNIGILTGTNTQLEANTQAIARAEQERAFNESLLQQEEVNWKTRTTGGPNPDSADAQLILLQDQLAGLLSRYTPDHPDVIKTENQIAELKKRMAEPPKQVPASAPAQSTHEPPQIQLLRAKLKQDDLTIANLKREQAQIQSQSRQLQARMEATPMVEQQYKEITRDHQTASDIYNDLLKKSQSSGMARDLVNTQDSEQFRVYDPPNLPVSPSFPKKPYFVGGGALGGLAVGFGILFLLAMMDKTIHSEHDAELFLQLPVLTVVPTLAVAGLNGNNAVADRKQQIFSGV